MTFVALAQLNLNHGRTAMLLLCKLVVAVAILWVVITLVGDVDGAARHLSFRVDLICQGGRLSVQLARVHEALAR